MPNTNPQIPSPLIGLLGAVLGGHPDVQNHIENTGQSMDDILGAITGQGSSPQPGSNDPLSGLLGTLMGGGNMPSNSQPSGLGSGGDALGGILGALMTGGQTQTGPGMGVDPVSNIIGGLLGGGAGGSALGSNAFLAPIVDSLAAKIGVDPKIAEMVVSFALTKLMAAQSGSRSSDVSGLVDRMGSGKPIDQKFLKSTGLIGELASQSGLDTKTAAQSLAQVLNAFSKQMG